MQFGYTLDNSARIRLLSEAWTVFKENKWLGVGLGNFQLFVKNKYSTQTIEQYIYPHNILLEMLACTGLLGFSIFAILIIVSFAYMHRILLLHPPAIYLIGYPFYLFMSGQFSGNHHDFRLFWFIVLVLLSSLRKNQIAPRSNVEWGG